MGSKRTYNIFSLVLFAGLAGCSTPLETGYLSDYGRLEEGQFLERYFADQAAISSGDYAEIVLATVSIDAIQDEDGVKKAECAQWLRQALVNDLSLTEPVVVASAGEGSTAELSMAITEMSPGSARSRILAGELGAGHAWIQLEGIVTDSRTEAVLASFAERRQSSGDIGIDDLGGDSGPSLVRQMIEAIGRDIRSELGASFGLR